MSIRTADNEALVQREVREVWDSGGDLEEISDLVTDDFVYHNPMIRDPVHGPDEYRALAETFRNAFSDIKMEVDEMYAVDDVVTTRYTTRATHDGEIFGIEPTHTKIEITGILIDHLKEGKLEERHVNDDALGLFEQIGAVKRPDEGRPD
ncbi:ester cyclase [Haladaptatus caseinilyticus]|uniref:ester cyclase n=1 Tax=Haladaptatus caseinilyticus TaxID=2993314 RepID=UPI00224A68D7|nr:ester cyclase [Haladaptatus caseinilyticus]